VFGQLLPHRYEKRGGGPDTATNPSVLRQVRRPRGSSVSSTSAFPVLSRACTTWHIRCTAELKCPRVSPQKSAFRAHVGEVGNHGQGRSRFRIDGP
jgi:hypothetical protein